VTHSSCVHNPAAGYGRELGIGTLVQARFRRRIVIVGAGPAGMKAAETAARLAHEVILIERRTRTGGQRRIAAKMAGRGEIAGAVDHLDVMIGKIRGRTSVISGVDTVVLAGWHRPVSDLYFALKGEGTSVERVGDAIASRTMMEAVHEGERAARRIPAYALT
jgi:NADPH-dependent 2,4-dienoyl-CoA reductase/sulfur reductase-like enzyme